MCVYQSLIVYIINMWCIGEDKDFYEKLQMLFSKYNHIVDAALVIYYLFK